MGVCVCHALPRTGLTPPCIPSHPQSPLGMASKVHGPAGGGVSRPSPLLPLAGPWRPLLSPTLRLGGPAVAGQQPQPCCPGQPLGGSKDHPWRCLLPQPSPGVAWSQGAGGADPLGPEVRWQWGLLSVPPVPVPQALWWLFLRLSQGWSEEGITVLSPEECLASWGTWVGKRQRPDVQRDC